MEKDNVAIKVENLTKTFVLPHHKPNSIKSYILNPLLIFKKSDKDIQNALKNINFEIKEGEFFGIVGRNGSGKSTLLKCLAGVYEPDEGTQQVNGKLVPFIELGVGFNPELSGRDNVYLNGSLLGFTRSEMEELYDQIVEFAELEEFMDQKLKNYSSGMQVRLAFSIAIRAKGDILLLDEVLAVGDAAFQTKCFDYFQELKNNKSTVVFVSHDKTSLERFCDRGILIENGKIIDSGPIRQVLKNYTNIVLNELEKSVEVYKKQDSVNSSRNDMIAQIMSTKTFLGNKENNKFSIGDSIKLKYEVKFFKTIKNPIFGVTVWCKGFDKPVFALNTLMNNSKPTGTFKKGQNVVFSVDLPSSLNNGEYYIEPAIANESASVFYDQVEKASTFFIQGGDNPYSVLHIATKPRIEIK